METSTSDLSSNYRRSIQIYNNLSCNCYDLDVNC